MIRELVIIVLIFAILVLGQQTYFRKLGMEAYKKVEGWGISIWQKCQEYWNKHILSRFTSEVEKRQNIAKEEIKDQAKQVGGSLWTKVKNYIVGLFNGVLGKSPQ